MKRIVAILVVALVSIGAVFASVDMKLALGGQSNGNIEISTYNYSTVVYGLLVAENHGKITNCSIEGPNLAMINLNLFGPSSSTVSNVFVAAS